MRHLQSEVAWAYVGAAFWNILVITEPERRLFTHRSAQAQLFDSARDAQLPRQWAAAEVLWAANTLAADQECFLFLKLLRFVKNHAAVTAHGRHKMSLVSPPLKQRRVWVPLSSVLLLQSFWGSYGEAGAGWLTANWARTCSKAGEFRCTLRKQPCSLGFLAQLCAYSFCLLPRTQGLKIMVGSLSCNCYRLCRPSLVTLV